MKKAITVLACGLALASPAMAQTAEHSFFAGKTITLLGSTPTASSLPTTIWAKVSIPACVAS